MFMEPVNFIVFQVDNLCYIRPQWRWKVVSSVWVSLPLVGSPTTSRSLADCVVQEDRPAWRWDSAAPRQTLVRAWSFSWISWWLFGLAAFVPLVGPDEFHIDKNIQLLWNWHIDIEESQIFRLYLTMSWLFAINFSVGTNRPKLCFWLFLLK